jgi:transcriptional regulator GlxA family with amidase domain
LEVGVVRDVVALVAEPVAEFELGVLCEVFGLDRSGDGLPCFSFAVGAVRPGLIRTSSGFEIKVEHGLERLGHADLIAVPGWSTAGAPAPDEVVAELRAAVERGARVLGICSGSFLLAAAGLLDGRRAATHWRYAARLAEMFPAVTVDAAGLYVDCGPVVTTAGTAAAIDACLHLVRVDHGAAVANAIARRMVVAAHRNGGQAQFIEAAVPVDGDDQLAAVLDWAAQRLDAPISVGAWANQARMSPRTFARRFRAATGTTPRQWLIDQRILHAQRLLEDTSLSVESVARAVGFGSADALRHHMAARRGTTPSTHRRAFATASVNRTETGRSIAAARSSTA